MRINLLGPLLLTLVACSQSDPGSGSRSQAKQVADAYAEKLAMVGDRSVTVTDAGQNWLVTYHGKKGWAGGDNRVWVDKRTMKVVDAIGEQ